MRHLFSTLVFSLVICVASQANAQCSNLGDANGDGVTNLSDIPAFIACLQNSNFNAVCDINQDGSDNFLDISPFVALATYERGDVNQDGSINFSDISSFGNAITEGENGTYDALADINEDCVVDSADIPPFITLLQQQ